MIDQTVHVNDAIRNNTWLSDNENGRIMLSTNQQSILESVSYKYDEEIINCLMSMIGFKYGCKWQKVRLHQVEHYDSY